MGDKGKRDKGKHTLKEKRKQKKDLIEWENYQDLQ